MMDLSAEERAALLDAFRLQAGDLLTELEDGLLALERMPEDDEALNAVFRAAHTIKGDAQILGLDDVALASHALEDVLDQLREDTLAPGAELVSALLAAGDALRGMIFRGPRPEHQAAFAALAQAARVPMPAVRRAAGTREPQASTPSPDGAARSRTLRIDVGKLDRMLDLAGEIAIARGRVTRLLEALPHELAGEILEAHVDADRLHFELQEHVMRARMVPIGPFLRHFTRTVREAAITAGKEARLVVEEGDVEVDTRVLEQLRDPLVHMVRNAVDHGIETPERRVAAGKPREGAVTLAASHEGGQIVLRLTDDGAGFDVRRIAERARTMGLATHPEQLPRAELLRLVFAPGFSTAESVTELSGRGVGMDVVRRNVESLRGTIELESRDGDGSDVLLRLPLTLAIIDGFFVDAAGETYVLPLHAVIECLALPTDRTEDGNGRGVISSRGAPLPFVRLRTLFGADEEGARGGREHVVVVEHDRGRAGLVVERIHGEGIAVIKPLGRMLASLPALAGSTILSSGRVGLIVDVAALVQNAQQAVDPAAAPPTPVLSRPQGVEA